MLYEQDWIDDATSRPKGYGLLSLLDPVRDEVFCTTLTSFQIKPGESGGLPAVQVQISMKAVQSFLRNGLKRVSGSLEV